MVKMRKFKDDGRFIGRENVNQRKRLCVCVWPHVSADQS